MKKLLFILLVICSCNKQNPHTCPFNGCPFKEEITFTHGCGYCDQGSDCWALDSLHFEFPFASYDDLEDKLFKQPQ